jgi:hypothetical protein
MRAVGSGGPGSLLMMWTESVLAQLIGLVSWPIVSPRLDDLAQLYVAREARDSCLLAYRLEISRAAGAVKSVTVSAVGAPPAGGDCPAPLMVPERVSLSAGKAALPAAPVGGAPTVSARVPAHGVLSLSVAAGSMPWAVPPPPPPNTAG